MRHRNPITLLAEAFYEVAKFVINLGEWLRAYPFRPNTSPFELIPTYQRWFQDWVDHSDFDDYWKQNGYTFELSYDKIPDIPILSLIHI